MEKAAKEKQIGEIKTRFDKMTAAVILDFKGMSVEKVTKLRSEFRKAGVDYKVVKNTLVTHAIKELGEHCTFVKVLGSYPRTEL